MRTGAALKGEIQPRQAPRQETFPTFYAFVTGTRGIINGVHAPRNDPPGQIGADCTFTWINEFYASAVVGRICSEIQGEKGESIVEYIYSYMNVNRIVSIVQNTLSPFLLIFQF